MIIIVPNEFEEENEFNEKTRIIGEQSYQSLKPTLSKIIETQTQMIFDGKTQRIGETKESTIVDEFWTYYSQFSSENLPSEEIYYGENEAEYGNPSQDTLTAQRSARYHCNIGYG